MPSTYEQEREKMEALSEAVDALRNAFHMIEYRPGLAYRNDLITYDERNGLRAALIRAEHALKLY
ncbi:MAG: hypothetical protein ACH37Z_18625 [Anaerolineae bacterium]